MSKVLLSENRQDKIVKALLQLISNDRRLGKLSQRHALQVVVRAAQVLAIDAEDPAEDALARILECMADEEPKIYSATAIITAAMAAGRRLPKKETGTNG